MATKERSSEGSYLSNLFGLFTHRKDEIGKAFKDYHLIRRRYIVSRTATHFGKDKHEPAPLLNRTLLDVGCGTSKLAEEMTFRGAEVTAIDANVDAIAYAKEQAVSSGAIVDFRNETPQELAQKGEKFDVILCMDLFEYVNHTSELLKSLHTLLKDDGIILFSCNNRTIKSMFWHIFLAQKWMKWFPEGTYIFKRFRNINKLIKKVGHIGFEVKEVRGVTFDLAKLTWRRTKKADIRYVGYATKVDPLD